MSYLSLCFRRRWLRLVCAMTLMTFVPHQVVAQHGIAALYPAHPTNFVMDEAHLFSPTVVDSLTHVSQRLQTERGGDIMIVTIPDLGEYTPADVALQIGRDWKVGAMGPQARRSVIWGR